MLSLRSLAFILYSAIRRACALSCAALHCFPDRTKALIIEKKIATTIEKKTATNSAAFIQSPTNSLHPLEAPAHPLNMVTMNYNRPTKIPLPFDKALKGLLQVKPSLLKPMPKKRTKPAKKR